MHLPYLSVVSLDESLAILYLPMMTYIFIRVIIRWYFYIGEKRSDVEIIGVSVLAGLSVH